MKLSTKINLGFSLFLLIPLLLILTVAVYIYTTRLSEKTQAKFEADLKVAELLLAADIDEFRGLVASYARRKGLVTLWHFKLSQKLGQELETIRQTDRLDEIQALSVQESLQSAQSREALSSGIATAGLTVVDHELSYDAAAPVFDRNGVLIGAFQIRRSLSRSDLLEVIGRETGSEPAIHLYSPDEAFFEFPGASLPIRDIQGQVLGFLSLQAPSGEFRDATTLVLFHALWIAGFSGLLSLAAWRALFANTILRPILELKQMADRIGEGSYSTRVSVLRDDEIGELGRNFNTMAGQVQQALDAYIELNEGLELRVKERTAKLEQTLQELRRTQAQLLARERLATLGELTAGIAHEIKNPLYFAGNFSHIGSELLEELQEELRCASPNRDAVDDLLEQLPGCLQQIQEHTDRAVQTIHHMLKHTRHEAGESAPVVINRLVKDEIALAYHGMRVREGACRFVIEEDYAAELDHNPLVVMPQELSRALLNIALNACDALTRKHKREDGGYTPVLRVTTEDTGQEVLIRLRDNGDGIPEELRTKVFEPFFTTRPAGEGTGLGLSIAYDIIHNIHQGGIEIVSEPGAFTECVIRLPKNLPVNS